MCSECTRIALKRCEIKIFLRSMPPDTLGTARHWHSYTIASFPGPSRGVGERAWYILHAHAPGDPRKMWGNRILSYTLYVSPIELYVMQNPQTITMVTRLIAMDTPAHARAVCTKSTQREREGPVNEPTSVCSIGMYITSVYVTYI